MRDLVGRGSSGGRHREAESGGGRRVFVFTSMTDNLAAKMGLSRHTIQSGIPRLADQMRKVGVGLLVLYLGTHLVENAQRLDAAQAKPKQEGESDDDEREEPEERGGE